jgi:hypothetical protein
MHGTAPEGRHSVVTSGYRAEYFAPTGLGGCKRRFPKVSPALGCILSRLRRSPWLEIWASNAMLSKKSCSAAPLFFEALFCNRGTSNSGLKISLVPARGLVI